MIKLEDSKISYKIRNFENQFLPHSSPVSASVFNRNLQRIYSGGSDGMIIVWEYFEGVMILARWHP
jgi:WD40 repeat protein